MAGAGDKNVAKRLQSGKIALNNYYARFYFDISERNDRQIDGECPKSGKRALRDNRKLSPGRGDSFRIGKGIPRANTPPAPLPTLLFNFLVLLTSPRPSVPFSHWWGLTVWYNGERGVRGQMEEEIRKAIWEALEASGVIGTRYLISDIVEELEAREEEQKREPRAADAFGALTYAMRVIEGGSI